MVSKIFTCVDSKISISNNIFFVGSQKKISRPWTTPTRQLCRKIFRNFYDSKKYPSSKILQEAIDSHKEFENTTVEKLRSHLQYDFRYINTIKSSTD